jgi:hypothetical protein
MLYLIRGDKTKTKLLLYWRLREIFQGYSKEVSVTFFWGDLPVTVDLEVLRLGVKGTLREPGQNLIWN